jgi:uncharacterized membrane protein YkvA (DUF1232 family)
MNDHVLHLERAQLLGRLAAYARAAGRATMERALQLYYASRAPHTPTWARNVMYGGLAYLLLPIDAIPDLLPGLGFVDDTTVLVAALATVAMNITPEVKQQASRKIKAWLGG